MDRRQMITTATAVSAAGVFQKSAAAEGPPPKKALWAASPKRDDCLKACQECEVLCNELIDHCLNHLAKGSKDHAACVRFAISCQDLCSLSVRLIARSCEFSSASCKTCAQACDACADACEKLGSDRQLAACAKACRQCAKRCRDMG